MNLYKDPYQHYPLLHPQELRGTEGMRVDLISCSNNPYQTIAAGQSVSYRPWKMEYEPGELLKLMKDLEEGRVWAGQAFEAINFTFAIYNVTRVTTHQLVRLRIGGGFMQESGREGSWDKAQFITPLTILQRGYYHAKYVHGMVEQLSTYRKMIDAGVPVQDARMLVGHGIAQNIWMTVNMRALMEWCSKRLCTTMQWEINTLARMIRDEVLKKYPHLGIMLKSNCERKGQCIWSKAYRGSDSAMYYQPGAENNGNKVYFRFEGDRCGEASGVFTKEDIQAMLQKEREGMMPHEHNG